MERHKLRESVLIFAGGLSLGAALIGVGFARYHKRQVDEIQQQWRHRGVLVDWRGLRECLPVGSHCDDLSQVLYTGGSLPANQAGESAAKNTAKPEEPDATGPSGEPSEFGVVSETVAAVAKATEAQTLIGRASPVGMTQQITAKSKPSAAIPMNREETAPGSEEPAGPADAEVEASAGRKRAVAAKDTKPTAHTMVARISKSFKSTKAAVAPSIVARADSKPNVKEAKPTAFRAGLNIEPLATSAEPSAVQQASVPARVVESTERAGVSTATLNTRQEVAQILEHWASTLARGKMSDHLAFYADEVNPYFEMKHPVSKDTVRKDKSRLLAGGTLVSLSVDDIRVVSSRPGSAVAVFEKMWRTRNGNGVMTDHQTWSRMQLERRRDGWRITGEQDLL